MIGIRSQKSCRGKSQMIITLAGAGVTRRSWRIGCRTASRQHMPDGSSVPDEHARLELDKRAMRSHLFEVVCTNVRHEVEATKGRIFPVFASGLQQGTRHWPLSQHCPTQQGSLLVLRLLYIVKASNSSRDYHITRVEQSHRASRTTPP